MHFQITMDQRCVVFCFLFWHNTEQQQLFVYQNKRSKSLLCVSDSEREEVRVKICVFVLGWCKPAISPGALCFSFWFGSATFPSDTVQETPCNQISHGSARCSTSLIFSLVFVKHLYLSLKHKLKLCFIHLFNLSLENQAESGKISCPFELSVGQKVWEPLMGGTELQSFLLQSFRQLVCSLPSPSTVFSSLQLHSGEVLGEICCFYFFFFFSFF